MKSFVICESKDTLLSMRLAGIGGVIVSNQKETQDQIEQILKDEETGIIMISENVFSENAEYIMEKKLTERKKLIIQIPEPEGLKDKDYIMNYIRTSIGIKL